MRHRFQTRHGEAVADARLDEEIGQGVVGRHLRRMHLPHEPHLTLQPMLADERFKRTSRWTDTNDQQAEQWAEFVTEDLGGSEQEIDAFGVDQEAHIERDLPPPDERPHSWRGYGMGRRRRVTVADYVDGPVDKRSVRPSGILRHREQVVGAVQVLDDHLHRRPSPRRLVKFVPGVYCYDRPHAESPTDRGCLIADK